MSDVRVFYASEDRKLVSQLVKLLEKHMTVWWDRRIDEGRWERHVDEQLVASKLAIVVWSKTSVGKEIVVAEARRAIKRGKPLLMLRVHNIELPLQVPVRQCLIKPAGMSGNSLHGGAPAGGMRDEE